ncbi:MAG: serine hydrolase domain-containing protein [Ignavibacteriota bacterium]
MAGWFSHAATDWRTKLVVKHFDRILCAASAACRRPSRLSLSPRMLEEGRLNLDDKVFADILVQLKPESGKAPDVRLKDVTVRQLLHNTGGHGRDTGSDPLTVGLAQAAAQIFHLGMPPGYDAMIRVAEGMPLDFDPGTKYSYSNYGFTVLGRVMERVTGQTYEDAVRQHLLTPLGLNRMAMGRTLVQDRLPGEVHYYDAPRAPLVYSLLANLRSLLPMPYANFELEASDSAGRWIASVVDLARFVARVEGTRSPAFLRPDTFKLLIEKPEPFIAQDSQGQSWYALGTGRGPANTDDLLTRRLVSISR